MIEYVSMRLREWGTWSAERVDGQFWRVRQFNYQERMPVSNMPDATVPVHERAMQTEQAVATLRLQDHRCFLVTISAYRDRVGFSVGQQSLLLGICKRTFYRRMDRSHILILGTLNDLEAGLSVPAIRELKKIA